MTGQPAAKERDPLTCPVIPDGPCPALAEGEPCCVNPEAPMNAAAGRAAALADLEHALALALQAMADNDCCADPDDPDWRGPAIEQFRADLRALGVSDQELDAAGIRYTPDVITIPQHRLREAGL